jgi:hypothetical protein
VVGTSSGRRGHQQLPSSPTLPSQSLSCLSVSRPNHPQSRLLFSSPPPFSFSFPSSFPPTSCFIPSLRPCSHQAAATGGGASVGACVRVGVAEDPVPAFDLATDETEGDGRGSRAVNMSEVGLQHWLSLQSS